MELSGSYMETGDRETRSLGGSDHTFHEIFPLVLCNLVRKECIDELM